MRQRREIRRVCECGATENVVAVRDYPWDGSENEGSIMVLIGYRCVDRAACQARRVAARGPAMPETAYDRGIGQGYGQQE